MTLRHFACIQKGQSSKNIQRLILLPIKYPIYLINAIFAIAISEFPTKICKKLKWNLSDSFWIYGNCAVCILCHFYFAIRDMERWPNSDHIYYNKTMASTPEFVDNKSDKDIENSNNWAMVKCIVMILLGIYISGITVMIISIYSR